MSTREEFLEIHLLKEKKTPQALLGSKQNLSAIEDKIAWALIAINPVVKVIEPYNFIWFKV